MGKYNVIKSTPDNDTAWLLEKIVNELAESNRLKRIEMKGMSVKWCGNIIKHGDLEDQA